MKYRYQSRTDRSGRTFQANSDEDALSKCKRTVPSLTLVYRETETGFIVLFDKYNLDSSSKEVSS